MVIYKKKKKKKEKKKKEIINVRTVMKPTIKRSRARRNSSVKAERVVDEINGRAC
jgi:hypothetical protein